MKNTEKKHMCIHACTYVLICGMYVLYIIISLLKNKECPNFTDRIPDKEMEKLRKIFLSISFPEFI